MTSFTEFGYINGPIMGVPEDYKPEVVITDEEFDALYAGRNEPVSRDTRKKNQFLARDYSLVQFEKTVKKIYEDWCETYRCPEELLVTFPKDRLRALFWGVDSCSCCITHCHKAPGAIDTRGDRDMTDRFTAEEIEGSRCHCHCRMWKRKLRRAFFEEIPLFEEIPPLVVAVEEESDDETRTAGSVSEEEIVG
jgi:hypothetical protein